MALYLTFGGSSVMGVMTGWIASYSEWVRQFGAIGWWITGLIGALIVALIACSAIQLRYAWVRSKAVQGWKVTTDSFNPMADDFNRLRIRISDLADPVTNRITGKVFTNCDLIGPANIVFLGQGSLTRVGFVNCDVIAARPGTPIFNAIGLVGVTMTGGRIANATIIVQDYMVKEFIEMGAPFISYLKDEVDRS